MGSEIETDSSGGERPQGLPNSSPVVSFSIDTKNIQIDMQINFIICYTKRSLKKG